MGEAVFVQYSRPGILPGFPSGLGIMLQAARAGFVALGRDGRCRAVELTGPAVELERLERVHAESLRVR